MAKRWNISFGIRKNLFFTKNCKIKEIIIVDKNI